MPKYHALVNILMIMAAWTANASENPRWQLIINDPGVTSIAEGDEYYWAGTAHGLSRIDKTGANPVVFHHSNSALVSDNIFQVCPAHRPGEFWIGHSEGVQRFDGNTFYPLVEIPSERNFTITAMAVDSLEQVWVAQGYTYGYFSKSSFGYVDTTGIYRDALLENPGFPFALMSSIITNIECDRNGGVWLSAVGGHGEVLGCLRDGQWNMHHQLRAGSIALDQNDGLWILGHRDRLERTVGLGYIAPGGTVEWIDSDSVPFDMSEILGISPGCGGAGVLVYDTSGFFKYSEGDWSHTSVDLEEKVSAKCMSDGSVWFYSGKKNPFWGRNEPDTVPLHRVTAGGATERVYVRQNRTPQTRFRDIVFGNAGAVWSLGDSLWEYSAAGIENRPLAPGTVNISHSPDGRLYAGFRVGSGSAGMRVYAAGGYQDYWFGRKLLFVGDFAFDFLNRPVFFGCTYYFDQMYAVRLDTPGLVFLDSISISGRIPLDRRTVMGPDSTVWVQSTEEIISFSLGTHQWRRISRLETDVGPRGRFDGIAVDSSETIWVGSENGFVRCDFTTGAHSVLGAVDSGEANARVYSTGPDGSVWGSVAVADHIHRPARIRNDSLVIYNSTKDPFMYMPGGAAVDSAGTVWFATRNSIVIFNPDGLSESMVSVSKSTRSRMSGERATDRIEVNPVAGNRIRAILPAAGRTKCRVYDSRGRLISSVDHGRLISGSHSLDLFPTTSGAQASSMYFAHIEVIGVEGHRAVGVVSIVASPSP